MSREVLIVWDGLLRSFGLSLPQWGALAARFKNLQVIVLAVRRAPVDAKELRQGAFDGGGRERLKDEC